MKRESESTDATTSSKRVKVTSKVDADESMNSSAIKAMAKAEALAVTIMQSINDENSSSKKSKKPRAPTEAEVTSVLLAMGDNWPTQVRPNVSDSAVNGMCLGMVNAFTAGLRVSLASQRCREVKSYNYIWCYRLYMFVYIHTCKDHTLLLIFIFYVRFVS